MTDQEYHAREMRDQLDRGPYPGEDFFRLQVTGNGSSRWINVSPAELEAIAAVLAGEEASTS